MASNNNTNQEDTNQESVRKIQRTGRDGQSYMVTLPKDMVDELDWRERQKVEVKRGGKKLIIEDWKPE